MSSGRPSGNAELQLLEMIWTGRRRCWPQIMSFTTFIDVVFLHCNTVLWCVQARQGHSTPYPFCYKFRVDDATIARVDDATRARNEYQMEEPCLHMTVTGGEQNYFIGHCCSPRTKRQGVKGDGQIDSFRLV